MKYLEKELLLEEAINNDDMAAVKRLIKDNALDTNNSDQRYLLGPCTDGNLKMIKFLVKSGADIHSFFDEPLANAVKNGHYDVVKFLISKGANVNDAAHEPLMISKEKKYKDIEILLKKHGAAVENFYLF